MRVTAEAILDVALISASTSEASAALPIPSGTFFVANTALFDIGGDLHSSSVQDDSNGRGVGISNSAVKRASDVSVSMLSFLSASFFTIISEAADTCLMEAFFHGGAGVF